MATTEYVDVKDLKVGDKVVTNPFITYTVKSITPRAYDWVHIEWEPSSTEKESFSNLKSYWTEKVER